MPFSKLYAHFVWSTHKRELLIDPLWEINLHHCIASSARSSGAKALAVGGIADHVHVLVEYPPSLALATLVANLKGSSSHFVNHEINPDYPFVWESDYFVASVSAKDVPRLMRYIGRQKEHHAGQIAVDWEMG